MQPWDGDDDHCEVSSIPIYLRRWMLVLLAGLEPATCCLGDNCQSSGLYGPVGLARSGWAAFLVRAVWFGAVVACGMTARMTAKASKDMPSSVELRWRRPFRAGRRLARLSGREVTG